MNRLSNHLFLLPLPLILFLLPPSSHQLAPSLPPHLELQDNSGILGCLLSNFRLTQPVNTKNIPTLQSTVQPLHHFKYSTSRPYEPNM